MAHFTRYIDIWQEMHLDFYNTITMTCLTASTLDIEAEASRFVAAHLGFRGLAEKLSDRIKKARIRRWIRTRCPADWRLIDINNLIDMLQAKDFLMSARFSLRMIQPGSNPFIQDLIDQGALARTRHARYQCKNP